MYVHTHIHTRPRKLKGHKDKDKTISFEFAIQSNKNKKILSFKEKIAFFCPSWFPLFCVTNAKKCIQIPSELCLRQLSTILRSQCCSIQLSQAVAAVLAAAAAAAVLAAAAAAAAAAVFGS